MFPAAVLLSIGVATLNAAQASSVPTTDACALLTSAQIQTVLGVTMTPGQPLTPTIHSSCKWLESGVNPFKARTVIVSVKSVQAYEVGKSVAIANLKTTAVSGIGDDAYMTSGNLSYGATLSVHKGGIAYVVTVRGYPDVPTLEEKEEALAKLVSY
jgi:hypothetical protein